MKVRSQFFKKDYDLSKAELIGQGTFAQVYRAFESGLNDSIAIRRVRKLQADLQDIIKQRQINDELRKVDNQNILKIYDIVQETEAVWYITEYCSGGSLWDALNLCPDNKMTERQALECVLQISRGVQQLHNHRITHRDLKPQNILLKTKYVPGKTLPLIKLADFGLSTRKIIMQTIAGTKEYIAPEQAKFHNYTNAVDVWSLGIIFDQILHGTPFYCGQDNKQVFSKILKMPFKVRDEGLRPSIKELLTSLLKKKPYERPIIAIIKVNIEKIIKEIEEETGNKLETPNQKAKKSKSNSNYDNSSTSQNVRSSIGFDVPHKINLTPKVQSITGYRSHNVIQKDMDRVQKLQRRPEEDKIDKGYYKKDIKPPSYQARPSVQKQVENVSTEVHDPKQVVKNLQKSTSINYFVRKVDRQKQKTPQKIEKVQHKQPQSAKPVRMSTTRQQPQLKLPLFGIAELPEKITIYKVQRKKMMGSTVSTRKQQLQFQLADISKYMQRVYTSKRELCEKQLKLEKERIFLPNTYLSAADFQKIIPSSNQILSGFTRKFEFLNYLSTSTSYEIKIIKATCQFEENRKLCEEELMASREAIRQLFFSQLYTFVDQFIDKVIK